MKTFAIAVTASSMAVIVAIAGLTFVWAGDAEQQEAESGPATFLSAAEEKIEAALRKPTEFDFFDEPLQTVIDHFRKKHGINILIDVAALKAVGIGTDEPITLTLSGVSLQSALNIILRWLDLTWTIRDEVLLVTTLDEAENMLLTRVYDVTDLVRYQERSGEGWVDYDTLVNVITATIEPDQWDTHPQIESVSVRGAEALVISQTRQIHRQIRRLFDQLRAVARETGVVEQQEAEFGPARFLSAAERKIEAALREPTEIDAFEEPLQTVVDHFSEKHKIDIFVDTTCLQATGINTDEPITLTLSGVSLQSALNLVLRQVDLTWMIRDELLQITTADEAEGNLITRVYGVTDLVEYQDKSGEMWTDRDSLINVITATIEPYMWGEIGGVGLIDAMPVGEAEALVVGQTRQVHRKIQRLLDQLRAVAKETGVDELPVREKPTLIMGVDGMGGGFGMGTSGSGDAGQPGGQVPTPGAPGMNTSEGSGNE